MTVTKRMRWEDLRIGGKTGPIQYTISAEVIDAFAEATEDFGEWHMKDSPFGARIAHLTLTTTDYMHLLSQAHGNLGTGMHSHQESEFFYPMRLGDTITTRGEIVDLFQRRERDYWVMVYESTNQGGRLLVRHRMTGTVDRWEQPSPAQPSPTLSSDRSLDSMPEGTREVSVDSTKAGKELPPISRLFTLEKQIRFFQQGGLRLGQSPPSPRGNTHTDREYARSLGLPGAVAQSNHYYAWYAEMMMKFLGEGFACEGTLKAKYFGIVTPGDLITVSGRVVDTKHQESSTRVFVEMKTTTQNGQPVSVASATGLLRAG